MTRVQMCRWGRKGAVSKLRLAGVVVPHVIESKRFTRAAPEVLQALPNSDHQGDVLLSVCMSSLPRRSLFRPFLAYVVKK